MCIRDRINCLHRDKRKNQLANVTRFWFEEKLCWVSLSDDNLYYTKDNFKTLFPFQDSEGKEPFKDDIINTWLLSLIHILNAYAPRPSSEEIGTLIDSVLNK